MAQPKLDPKSQAINNQINASMNKSSGSNSNNPLTKPQPNPFLGQGQSSKTSAPTINPTQPSKSSGGGGGGSSLTKPQPNPFTQQPTSQKPMQPTDNLGQPVSKRPTIVSTLTRPQPNPFNKPSATISQPQSTYQPYSSGAEIHAPLTALQKLQLARQREGGYIKGTLSFLGNEAGLYYKREATQQNDYYQRSATENFYQFAGSNAAYATPIGSALLVLGGAEQYLTPTGRKALRLKKTEQVSEGQTSTVANVVSYGTPLVEIGLGSLGVAGEIKDFTIARNLKNAKTEFMSVENPLTPTTSKVSTRSVTKIGKETYSGLDIQLVNTGDKVSTSEGAGALIKRKQPVYDLLRGQTINEYEVTPFRSKGASKELGGTPRIADSSGIKLDMEGTTGSRSKVLVKTKQGMQETNLLGISRQEGESLTVYSGTTKGKYVPGSQTYKYAKEDTNILGKILKKPTQPEFTISTGENLPKPSNSLAPVDNQARALELFRNQEAASKTAIKSAAESAASAQASAKASYSLANPKSTIGNLLVPSTRTTELLIKERTKTDNGRRSLNVPTDTTREKDITKESNSTVSIAGISLDNSSTTRSGGGQITKPTQETDQRNNQGQGLAIIPILEQPQETRQTGGGRFVGPSIGIGTPIGFVEPPIDFKRKKKQQEDDTIPYKAEVYIDATKYNKARWIQVADHVPKITALSTAGRIVDETPSNRFRITKEKGTASRIIDTAWNALSEKFREYSSKSGVKVGLRQGEYIEKRRYRLDNHQERRQVRAGSGKVNQFFGL